MSPLELARLLETEHVCEVCHTNMASAIFDCQPVCAACWILLERKLVECG